MTLETIFATASQKASAERAAFLDQACGNDAELRAKIERLLAAHDAAGSFLQPQTGNYESQSPSTEAVGTIIAGKYKLLERIGEGGMGSVWMAQQSEPVKRLVAVKLIKAGMDSKAVLARFEAERQALAVMDHPNIAKILDGGVVGDSGRASQRERDVSTSGSRLDARPFFVMELVKGIPITKYCDEHKLTPRERLQLFVPVCQAIQHAHQKGIIHRDIKPSNVMVALYDDKPVPKVIDFGVAKATGQTLTEQTLNTGFGGIVGTPEYMSPEQASLNNLDIDTRSDVYSLGVLLYELLAGSPPFRRKELEHAGLLEILRVIREEEPPRPSTKLSTADALPSLSANRGTEPKKLTGILRNELDWIVMKALEKDRTRRYETANGFAADINRYLAGEPVNAHPPSATYRIKKFLRKNKGPVIASAAVAAALLVGMIGFAWQARAAQRERDIAQAERQRAVTAEAETKKRADELQQVSDFQAQMLRQVNPTQAGKLLSSDVLSKFDSALARDGVPDQERLKRSTAFAADWQRVNATDAARGVINDAILKPAVTAIEKQFADQPTVEATLKQALARVYTDLGLYDAALPIQERALAIRRRLLGNEHPNTLQSIYNFGTLLQLQGKLTEAEPYLRELLDRTRHVFGADHPNTLLTLNLLGTHLQLQGKLSEAEPYVRDVMERTRRLLGEEHSDTRAAINNLATLLQAQGKLSEAERYYREALEKCRRVLGSENLYTLIAINNMGRLLHEQGKLTEAEPYYRELLEKARRLLGEEHPNTLASINNMGDLLKARGKLSEAEPYYREAMVKARRVLGEEHPDTLIQIVNMGSLLVAQGKPAEAAELLGRSELTARKALTGAYAGRLGSLLMNLGKARTGLHEFTDAERNLAEANGIFVRIQRPTQDTRDCTQALIDLYTAWHAAEPGKGYDGKAAEWKAKLEAMKSPAKQ